MPYTQPTLLQAQIALASRLNDPNNVHWVLDELRAYLREALRTWNTWVTLFHASDSFTTTPLEPFYDLPTVLPAERAFTVTNWDLVADLQYALLEPAAPGGTWTGTQQFTLDQLTTAIQRRRDQFLRETGVVLTRTVLPFATPPASGRIDLGEEVISVRRAAWRPTATQTLAVLQRTSEWAGTNWGPAWRQSIQPPYAYSVSSAPPPTFQMIPPTTLAGELDLVSINAGAPINSTVSTTLGIPDDYVWILKFGVLADLLGGDGLALDPARADYCEQRWQQGLDMARRAPVVLDATINDVTCRIAAVSDADSYSPTWQLVAGAPKTVLLTGQNLVALWPPPGIVGGPWTIGFDVVMNAPIPTTPTDVLPVDQTVYDSLLDVAQHIALFKEGPGQVDKAMAFLNRASRAAGVQLQFQQAQQVDRPATHGQQQQDRRSLPEQLVDVVPIPVED